MEVEVSSTGVEDHSAQVLVEVSSTGVVTVLDHSAQVEDGSAVVVDHSAQVPVEVASTGVAVEEDSQVSQPGEATATAARLATMAYFILIKLSVMADWY